MKAKISKRSCILFYKGSDRNRDEVVEIIFNNEMWESRNFYVAIPLFNKTRCSVRISTEIIGYKPVNKEHEHIKRRLK